MQLLKVLKKIPALVPVFVISHPPKPLLPQIIHFNTKLVIGHKMP